jgi:NAD(P)-dependent dehydrogenase (short-subunit alcohol dehydrogenase family)
MGKAAARRLAQGGASVVICGRRAEVVDQTVAELRGEGLEVSGLAADVGSAADMRRLIEHAVQSYGGVDVLVNSAGIQRYGTVVDTDEATWDEVFSTNVKGMYLAAKYAIPEMQRRGGGAIVNVSSVQAFASQTSVAAYTASKGAINALTRAMALDHAKENIRVVAVCPASVDTPMLRWGADVWRGKRSNDEMIAAWGKMHPIGRVGTAEEVAELIAFLTGPKAGFITGGEYKIDGGMLAALGVTLPE